MKNILTLLLIAILLMTCSLIGPNKFAEKYFSDISYCPQNITQIEGKYSTGVDLGGGNLYLFSDSSFKSYSWTDIYIKDEKREGNIGKYFIVQDTLYLVTLAIPKLDSLDIVREEFASHTISATDKKNVRHKYLFLKIGDDIYIINAKDKQRWINDYDFIGNVEDRILNHELKRIVD